MKIAYIIGKIDCQGGMERILCDKSNALSAKGIEVHILYLYGDHRKVFFEFDKSVIFHPLNMVCSYEHVKGFLKRRASRKEFDKLLYKNINNTLKAIIADISIWLLLHENRSVFSQLDDGSKKISEMHFAKQKQVNIINWNLQKTINNFWKSIKYKQKINELNKIDRVVVLTDEDLKQWSELSNCVVIPNFSNLAIDKNHTADYSLKKVISVGRLESQKGYDYLIDAWAIVAKIHPNWQLSIVGDGPLRQQLQEQINRLGLEKNITLEGAVKNIKSVYERGSIYVMSSPSEGFGLVLLEAMQHQLPVVSYASSGPRYLIDHNDTGMLIDETGDVDALAEALIKLIDSEELRRCMGRKGYEKSKQFDKDVVIDKWISLFNELMDEEQD